MLYKVFKYFIISWKQTNTKRICKFVLIPMHNSITMTFLQLKQADNETPHFKLALSGFLVITNNFITWYVHKIITKLKKITTHLYLLNFLFCIKYRYLICLSEGVLVRCQLQRKKFTWQQITKTETQVYNRSIKYSSVKEVKQTFLTLDHLNWCFVNIIT